MQEVFFYEKKKDRTDPSACSLIVVRLIFEQIARLAVKHLADLIESGKADCVDLIVFFILDRLACVMPT